VVIEAQTTALCRSAPGLQRIGLRSCAPLHDRADRPAINITGLATNSSRMLTPGLPPFLAPTSVPVADCHMDAWGTAIFRPE
jgi:hypothetical protein